MQIRLPKLNVTRFILDGLAKNTIHKNIFLGEFGKYEIIEDKIVLFKHNPVKCQEIPNYLNGMSALIQQTSWLKHTNTNYLPTSHVLVSLRIVLYNITKRLRLCIEYIADNAKIIDWYFIINEQTSLAHVKNDLYSFVEKAKKS